jgi:hypothetical protein
MPWVQIPLPLPFLIKGIVMAGKIVTIKINTSEKKYEADMDMAKNALIKVREAKIDSGEITINGINIKIEENNHCASL